MDLIRLLRVKTQLPLLLKRCCSYERNKNSIEYCASIVKQHDYENFMATLLMTKAIRSPALVIRAFNVEIAKIQDQTSDPQTAAFRLQFWHDTIDSIFKKDITLRKIPANPVAQELFKVCACYNLPRRHLDKLVTSRRNILKNKHFQTIEEYEKYAEDTVSSIYYLLLSVAGVTNVHADHAASHLGKAQGMANMLRSVYVASKHKTVILPMDMLMNHQISQENVLRGVDDENMRDVVFEISSRANSHLQKARSIAVPKLVNQILLPAISVDNFLKKLQKANFNIFDSTLQQQGSGILPLNFYFKRLMNKY